MKYHVLKNEKGMVWVIALLMLLVLTLLGISSVSSSIFETNISGNDRFGADAFYAAEAGIHVGLDQIPSTDPIARTRVGEDSYFWSGGPDDKSSPKALQSFGLHQKSGYDASWAFKRYQVNAAGQSLAAVKALEVQASMGPFNTSTQYNN